MKVSILIPHKPRGNRDRLTRAITSALNQTHDDIEVVVKACTPEIKGRRSTGFPYVLDERVVWIDGPDNSIAHALNIAARKSTGDVMHFACDDDEMTPDAVESALVALEPRRIQWTYGAIQICSYDAEGNRTLIEGNGGWAWSPTRMLEQNFIPQPSVFWKRDAWNARGPFDETLPLVFDYEMWGRLGSLYRPRVRSHVDAYYERWDESISVARQKEQWREVHEIQKRWRAHGLGWRPVGVLDAR